MNALDATDALIKKPCLRFSDYKHDYLINENNALLYLFLRKLKCPKRKALVTSSKYLHYQAILFKNKL